MDKSTCGISAIITATGMKRKDVLAHIEAGNIVATKQREQFIFEISEKNRLASLRETYVGFFFLTQKHAVGKNKFSLAKRICRAELLDFMQSNAWFGADAIPADGVFFADAGNEAYFVRKSDEERFAPNVRLWIASYGETPERKLRLLLDKVLELYPETGTLLNKFLAKEYPNEITAAWIFTDFLCSALHFEITQADDDTLDSLATNADKELPLNAARMFAAFLVFLRSKRKLGNGWDYRFRSRATRESSAYPIDSFFKMAYIVFNEDAWKTGRLPEKAMLSAAYANLWLFTAFHFVCGWRGTDIVRLPMPTLPCCGDVLREKLSNETFDANEILREVELRLQYTPMKPNKTNSFNVPDLKLFVAESLRKPLGFILAVAASHNENVQPGGAFIRSAGSVAELLDFFGADFLSACGNKSFNTRRANKAYLQGIEAVAGNSPGKPKGYMLAALARSHKSGYGTLPQTTEIYLRDARFSGYSPEFIAREMFERGVFSFIPALLLDIYELCDCEKLSVSAQTELIASVGVSPSGLENIASVTQDAVARARQSIANIMEHPLEMRLCVEDILQNIASGNAPGRQDGFLCLMTAAGFACKDPNRSCCIGCGYEIYTKTILRLLLSEYTRLAELKKTAGKAEAFRYDAMLKKAVLPAISEMLSAAERLYPNANIRPLLAELERGMRHADR
jgi:hypothetical protein